MSKKQAYIRNSNGALVKAFFMTRAEDYNRISHISMAYSQAIQALEKTDISAPELIEKIKELGVHYENMVIDWHELDEFSSSNGA